MNDRCDVVQDLLPLYIEGELRSGSKRYVDEHLKGCEDCRKLLNDSVEGEQLFRNVFQESWRDTIPGKKIWVRSLFRFLLKPAFWVLIVSLIGVVIFATMIKRPYLLNYEILTTAATAEEMLHPGFYRASQSRENNNALRFELHRFSAPTQKEKYTYIYRASLISDSIILDRLYPYMSASAEIYYPDVDTPQPAFMAKEILKEIDEPVQFSLSFNRFVDLQELKMLFDETEVEILWLGIATRDLSDNPNWITFWDSWGLPVWFLQNKVKDLDLVVQEEMRNRIKMLTDYKKYLAGIDPNLSERLEYMQKSGILVFGVIVRATGPEMLTWIDRYPIVRFYRRLS